MMQIKTQIVDGKKRIIVIKTASGISMENEIVLKIMGTGWTYDDVLVNKIIRKENLK